eukprot:1336604-Amorphochlora_amoeboformis.AAC.2
MSASAAIALALCALAPGANAAFEASTLVILDDPTVPQYHSIFFRNLKNRGHKVTFVSAKDRTLRLGKYGKYDYDNVILFSPQTEGICCNRVSIQGFKAEREHVHYAMGLRTCG